MAFQFIDKLCP